MLLYATIILLLISGAALVVGTILLFGSHKLLYGAGLPARERLKPKAVIGFACLLLGSCGMLWILSGLIQ